MRSYQSIDATPTKLMHQKLPAAEAMPVQPTNSHRHCPSAVHPVVAAITCVLLIAACATNPDGSLKMDDKANTAVIGAVAGCAIGALADGGRGCAAGAVIGGAAGFLIGWYFESKKLADAQKVNAEYERQIKSSASSPGNAASSKPQPLPKDQVVPAKFQSSIKKSPPDKSGQREVHITSNTDLVGYGDKVPDIKQKYALYDEHNKLVEEKTEKVTAVDGAGRYQTDSKFKLPADAKGKNYTVKTTLIANNTTYKENAYKVSWLDSDQLIIAALDPASL